MLGTAIRLAPADDLAERLVEWTRSKASPRDACPVPERPFFSPGETQRRGLEKANAPPLQATFARTRTVRDQSIALTPCSRRPRYTAKCMGTRRHGASANPDGS